MKITFAAIFLNSSAANKATAKGIKNIQTLRGMGAVAKIALPHSVYTINNWRTISTTIPAKISLFEKNPRLKTDSREGLHAKASAIWVTMIALRHAGSPQLGGMRARTGDGVTGGEAYVSVAISLCPLLLQAPSFYPVLAGHA